MTDINTIISTNFNENIDYIQTNHKELFEKLSAFDNAVVNGHYREKYELVYEDDAFDVVELQTQKRLYNQKSKKHTQMALESVDNTLGNSLFECFVRQEGQKPLEYVTPVVESINRYKNRDGVLHEFGKFVFFGVGLGLHISALHKKIKAKHYLVVEDDLELFRLSLFCTNYKEIAKHSKITFGVFEQKDEFLQICDNFLNDEYYLNHYIKYFQLLSHSDEKYNLFHLGVTNQPHIRFLFHDLLDSYTRPLEYFSNGYKILQKSVDFSSKEFENNPFLLVASGPSLQKNIEWIKANQHCLTIVSASSSLHFLEQNGVGVDIVLHIDPFVESKISINKLNSKDFIKDALVFLHGGVHRDFLKLFNKENVYLMEMGSTHQQSSFKLSGPCVGSAGLLLLILLKVKDVYLLGLDLAIDSKTGADHTSTHQSTKTLSTKEDAFEDQMSYKNNVFEIEGNLEPTVLSTPHFFGSIDIINRYYPQLKAKSQNIYNLSNGAKYTVATPKRAEDTQLEGCTKIQLKRLKEFVELHSSLLQQSDISRLELKLKNGIDISKAIQNYNYEPTLGATKYMQDILLLSDVASNKDSVDELTQVIESFLKYILEYVYDFMISSHTDEEKCKVESVFRNELLGLIKTYTTALQNTIKGEDAKH